MKKYTDQLQKYLKTATSLATRYSFLLFLMIFGGLAGYLVMRIGNLSKLEPTAQQVTLKLQEVKKTNTDIENIQKLKELEGRNISIESLFDNGRNNPFED
ncbi:MAG: hypothetical protein AAB624_03560 [Patescibacteria group bacterium]